MSFLSRRIVMRILAIAGGLALALVLAEGTIRIFRPEPPAVNVGVGALRDERPSESYQFKRAEFDTWVEINSLGFHDHEHPAESDPSTLRVVVLGDSFVEASQVRIEETWWSVLGRTLEAATGRPVEIIALGQGGASTAKAWQILTEYGLGYQPDVVLLAFCVGNDTFNNSFQLEDKRRKGPFYSLDRAGRLVEVSNAEFEASLQRSWWPLWRASHLYRKTVRMLQRERELKRINPRGYHVLFEVYLERPPDVWNHAWEVTGALLDAVAASAAEVGAAMGVVVIPDRVQIHHEDWRGILGAHPGMERESWDLDRPNRLVAALLEQRGIPVLDPTSIMRERAAAGERLYFHNDIHFNLEGNRMVGREAGRFVAGSFGFEDATEKDRSAAVGSSAGDPNS